MREVWVGGEVVCFFGSVIFAFVGKGLHHFSKSEQLERKA